MTSDNELSHEDLFDVVDHEVSRCTECWSLWKSIWMDEEAIEVYRKAGLADFFRTIRDSIMLDISMTLARLLDPPEQGSKERLKRNLVLLRLIDDIGLTSRAEWTEDCQRAYQYLNEGFRPKVHEVRNKRLAHNDLGLLTGEGMQLRYGFTDTDLDKALAGLQEIMQAASYTLNPGLDRNDWFEKDAGYGTAAGQAMIRRLAGGTA